MKATTPYVANAPEMSSVEIRIGDVFTTRKNIKNPKQEVLPLPISRKLAGNT